MTNMAVFIEIPDFLCGRNQAMAFVVGVTISRFAHYAEGRREHHLESHVSTFIHNLSSRLCLVNRQGYRKMYTGKCYCVTCFFGDKH